MIDARVRATPAPTVAAVGLSLVLHGAAGWQFRVIEAGLNLPPEWRIQFYGLLCFSFALSVAMPVLRNGLAQMCLLGVRVLVFVLIGLPLGRNVTIELILQTTLLVDFAVHSRPVAGLLFSVTLIALGWLLQRPALAWNAAVPAPTPNDVMTLVVSGAGTLLLAQMVAHGRRRCLAAERRLAQLEHAVDQLTDANLGFQSYAATVGKSSVLEERNRVSREVHDTIGYTLTNLIIMLEACQDLIESDREALRQMLLRAGDLAQEGLNDTRRALHALRQSGVEELRGLRAIKRLADAFQGATGIAVEIEYGNIPWSLGEAVDRTIYRLLQEAMTNSFKHGKASRITIGFWKTDRDIIINVRDNGSGSKEIKEGIGISGMRERVEALGGEITARNAADGFEVSARVPLEETGEGHA